MAIKSGSTATLSVTATGTAPLTYQWYQGAVGTTTTPVGTNSASFTTPALTATTTYWVRITNGAGSVDSGLAAVTIAITPADLALIPAGNFQMGVTSGDTDSDAPSVSVTVSAFYMGKNEVTKAQWDKVRTWATANGYTDLAAGAGKAINHPVQTVSWWDVIKWCNARSQKEGLTPCYYSSGGVMKTGTTAPTVNWSANGYRLPTEAEWEKAARGGVSGKRFPWGTDRISHSQANYNASASYSYDNSGLVNNYHPTYATGSRPYTSHVGAFAANGYGLNDMAGNVWEWCWDVYSESTYLNGETNPRGSAWGLGRVVRGSNCYSLANHCRAAARHYYDSSAQYADLIGFRVARSSVPDTAPSITTQPVSTTVNSGSTATMSVATTDMAPLTYQWYQGVVGITTTPVGTNSDLFTTPALTATATYWVRITNGAGSVDSTLATVTVGGTTPADIALIPAGSFQMGATSGDTDSDAPSVSVTVSAFYMGKNEVTKALWDEVRTWAVANGYTDLAAGAGKAANHPVQTVSWWDVIKWCNARSQKEGLTPCYTVSGGVMKTGITAPTVNWSANGYRLPTEAEWEKAARGGVNGKRFPWRTDTINHNHANYPASAFYQ